MPMKSCHRLPLAVEVIIFLRKSKGEVENPLAGSLVASRRHPKEEAALNAATSFAVQYSTEYLGRDDNQ